METRRYQFIRPGSKSVVIVSPELLFNSWCSAHGFSPISSKRIKLDLQNDTWSVNLPFFLIDPPGFFQQEKVLSQTLRKFLHWKLNAFYSAILTSCTRHDFNNVKERRNAGSLAPNIGTL